MVSLPPSRPCAGPASSLAPGASREVARAAPRSFPAGRPSILGLLRLQAQTPPPRRRAVSTLRPGCAFDLTPVRGVVTFVGVGCQARRSADPRLPAHPRPRCSLSSLEGLSCSTRNRPAGSPPWATRSTAPYELLLTIAQWRRAPLRHDRNFEGAESVMAGRVSGGRGGAGRVNQRRAPHSPRSSRGRSLPLAPPGQFSSPASYSAWDCALVLKSSPERHRARSP